MNDDAENQNLTTFEERWGKDAGKGGFLMIPHALLVHQHALGISNSELVTLLNILAHWFEARNYPFPSANTLSKRMGSTQRTVERNLKNLLDKRLLATDKNERGTKCYDPSRLVIELAEFRKERSLAKR